MEGLEVRERVASPLELVLGVGEQPYNLVVLVEPRRAAVAISVRQAIHLEAAAKRRHSLRVVRGVTPALDERLDDLVALEVVEGGGRISSEILIEAPPRHAQLVFSAEVCAPETDVHHAAQGHPAN